MKSIETLSRQLNDSALTHDEQACLRCHRAEDLEHRGQYEAARDALGDLWQGIGQHPKLEGLGELTATEVLLRAGTLSGWFVHARQLEGLQDAAKDLISESITHLEALGESAKTAAAFCELAIFYRRAGANGEARVMYEKALSRLTDDDAELKATILLRLAVAEMCSGRNSDALRILTDATPLFEASHNHALKGKFHNELACMLTELSKNARRMDYTDRAILEYTAAAYHFEEAGHTGYRASVESNLGFLLYTIERYEEARQHLNHARRLFVSIKDSGRIAQVDDVLARVFLAEGKPQIADRVIGNAVRTLAKGGEQGVLAEALTTQGRVLARLKDSVAAQNKFQQAAELAEQAGAVEDAGRALLALIEEHAAQLAEAELCAAYERADELLKATQDAETIARLRACASRLVVARRVALPTERKPSRADFWADFSLAKGVSAYEARYIRRALTEARGSVSRAARLLGFRHHASLVALLQGRHRSLAHLRTTPGKRRQHLVRLCERRHTPEVHAKQPPRAVKILHVEDNELLAETLRETLELEGWNVQTVTDGTTALRHLVGDARYDLLLLDNELPGRNGIELVREARRLAHRQRTPIIMLSASDVQVEALRAGVDAFLRKPEEVGGSVDLIARLLAKRSKR